MNKPTFSIFLMGNNFSLVSAAALSLYMLALLTKQGTVILPALWLSLAATWFAWKARKRIRAYPHMGKAPVRRASVSAALLVWFGTMLWAGAHPYDDTNKAYELCGMLWSIASFALLFHATWFFRAGALRLLARRAKRQKVEHHRVMQSQRIPSTSPELSQILAALPSYASRCLR